jgi:hypothetical protein
MIQSHAPESRWWTAINIAVIACSATIVLYPDVRHRGLFIVPFGALVAVYAVARFRRESRNPLARLPLSGLYGEIRKGRRSREGTLQNVASVAIVLATLRMMTA